MPELPEVETVVRTLEKQIKDQQIIGLEVLHAGIIAYPQLSLFNEQILNQHFRQFGRRGKYLIFTLDDYQFIVHLRMEGKFFIKSPPVTFNKHDHVIFELSKGDFLCYNDVRKFGKMYLYPKGAVCGCLQKLGYEFFDEEMTPEYLYEISRNKKTELKSLLLDQQIILGVGNIYADEICFAAKLHPRTLISVLDQPTWKSLIVVAKKILSEAIAAGGTTIRSYTSAAGISGRFQLSLNVHSRAGQPCYNCGTIILKDRVAGRGTYYCPNCQKHSYHFVAITGRRASGKSLVLSYFKQFGFTVADSDKIVDSLLQKPEVLAQVADLLKLKFSRQHEENKKMIASCIFGDDELKVKYEKLIHPLVYQEIKKIKAPYCIVEVQRLFEAGFHRYFEAAIAVISSKENEHARLLNKKVTMEDIKRREKYQAKNSQLASQANFIITNNTDKEELKQAVSTLAKILKGEDLC